MRASKRWVACVTAASLVPGLALAGDFYIYPNESQSSEQQSKDDYECYSWAKGQTGFDPMVEPKATEPPPEAAPKQGGVAKDAARGAAIGAVGGAIGGAIGGDPGTGAAIGAATGAATAALFGGMRRRRQRKEEEAKQEQRSEDQAAAYEKRRSEYNQAYKACMGGRGYSLTAKS
jgi:hypothetical protein